MKKLTILLFLIACLIPISIIELSLRYLNLDRNVVYYSSTYYGYYKVGNQTVTSRKNKLISIDKLGNRNPKTNSIENSNLIFLGDSVTYGGSVVSDRETFANLVSKKLDRKYLNVSANGWGIPNIINFINFHDMIKENSTYVLTCINDCYTRNLRTAQQNFFFKSNNSFAIINFMKYVIFKINEHNYYFNDVDEDFIYKGNKETIHLSIEQLKNFKKKLNLANSKLIIIYSPNTNYIKDTIQKDKMVNHHESIYREEIFRKLKKENINFFNIIEFFSEKEINNFGRYFVDKVHLSVEGHVLYSKLITKFLNEQF